MTAISTDRTTLERGAMKACTLRDDGPAVVVQPIEVGAGDEFAVGFDGMAARPSGSRIS